MTSPEEPRSRRSYTVGKGRLEAFSDGVFAIAITLLVLDLAIPSSAGSHLLDAFLEEWPAYLGYIVSFATVAAIWYGHNAITDILRHADGNLLRLNMLLLLIVSLLPFPTREVADYIKSGSAERVAVTVYGVFLLLALVVLSGLWRYAVHHDLIRTDIAEGEIDALTRRVTPGIAGYLAMIVLGLFLPIVAVFGYLALALFVILPINPPWGRRSR